MKAIFAVMLVLTCVSVSAQAQSEDVPHTVPVTILPTPVVAQPVEIPAEVSDSNSFVQYLEDFKAVQLTEVAYLDAQTKYFQIMRTSLQAGRAMSEAYAEGSVKQAGVGTSAVTVNVVLDAYLAKTFFRSVVATGTLDTLKDIIFAARGEEGRLTAVASKTWKSVVELAKFLKVPKNFITTAAFGGFAYVQVETYMAINMSVAQYDAMMFALDAKIHSLEVRKAAALDPRAIYAH